MGSVAPNVEDTYKVVSIKNMSGSNITRGVCRPLNITIIFHIFKTDTILLKFLSF